MDIPSLAWKMAVPGCSASDRIRLTNAEPAPVSIQHVKMSVDLSASVSSLSQKLLEPCGDSSPSPLECLLHAILDSEQNPTIFISGRRQSASLPAWLPDILSALALPVPLPHVYANTSDFVS